MIPFVLLIIFLLSASHVASPVGPEFERARRIMSYWNKPIIVFGRGRTPKLHPTSRFELTVQTVPRPNIHPRGETMQELSFLVVNAHMTPILNNMIIACGSNATETKPAHWGLFNAEQFAIDRVQVEYFISVKRGQINKWRNDVEKFVRSGSMTKCISEKIHGFEGNVVYAKKAEIARPVKNGVLGEQLWVILVIVSISTVVVVEVFIILWLRVRRKKILASLPVIQHVRQMEQGLPVLERDLQREDSGINEDR